MKRHELTAEEFEELVQRLGHPVIESDGTNDYLTIRGTEFWTPVRPVVTR